MKEKQLGEIKSFRIENFFVIGLSHKWLKVFKTIPMFSVKIDNKNKLVLESIQSVPENKSYPKEEQRK